MLEKMIVQLDRDSLVSLISDETVSIDTLRMCVCTALGGDLEVLLALSAATAGPVVPPVIPGVKAAAVVIPPPAAKAPKAPKATPATVPANGSPMSLADIDAGIEAWRASGQGFAFADIKASLPGATESSLRGRLKIAVAQGRLVSHGEKRFCRYAAKLAAAKLRSESDRRSAGAPAAG